MHRCGRACAVICYDGNSTGLAIAAHTPCMRVQYIGQTRALMARGHTARVAACLGVTYATGVPAWVLIVAPG